MAIDCTGTVEDGHLRPMNIDPQNERLRMIVQWRIFDDAAPTVTLWPPTRRMGRMEVVYPLAPFDGLNPTNPAHVEEFWNIVLNVGAGDVPPLRTVRTNLLSDYAQGAILRGIPLPFEFGAI